MILRYSTQGRDRKTPRNSDFWGIVGFLVAMSEIETHSPDAGTGPREIDKHRDDLLLARANTPLGQHLAKLPPDRVQELVDIMAVLREKRPQFIHSFVSNADKTLEEYASSLLANATVPSDRLQRAFVAALSRHDPKIDGAAVLRELQKGILVDTSGHCGLIGDTESIHSLLLLGLAARQRGDSRVYALAGGGVPLDNATLPGGFYWDGNRVNLHSKKINGESSGSMIASTVEACTLQSAVQIPEKYKGRFDEHGFPATLEALAPERRAFASFLREEVVRPESLLRDIFSDKGLRFCDQVARVNEVLWSRLGGTTRGLPGLAYGLIEDVNCLILDELILKESTSPHESREPLYRLLFDRDLRNRVLEAFNSPDPSAPVVQGAWRHNETRAVSYGTHLFWLLEGTPCTDQLTGRLSVKNARQSRLSISESGILSNESRTFMMEMTPKNIRELIHGRMREDGKAEKLSPGTFLNILLLTMENCSIIGGMNQADYAATYQRILAPILSEVVPCQAVDNFKRLTLDNFCLGLLFTGIKGKEGSFEHLLLHPHSLVEAVNQNATTMSVAEAGALDITNWVNTIVPKAEFPEKLDGKVVEVSLPNGKTAWKLAPRFSFSNLYREMRSVTPSGS